MLSLNWYQMSWKSIWIRTSELLIFPNGNYSDGKKIQYIFGLRVFPLFFQNRKTFLCRGIRYFIWVWICTLEAEASKLAIKRPRVHTLLVSGIWFRLWPRGKKILFSSYTYVHDVLDDVDVMCSHFKVHNAPFLISNSVSTRFCL